AATDPSPGLPSPSLQHHAGERYDPVWIGPLTVPLHLAGRTAEDSQYRVNRREAADTAAVVVARDGLDERGWVSRCPRFEHLPVVALDLLQLGGRDGHGVAEAGAHVGEVGARDERDPAAARRDGLGDRLQGPGDARVVVGPPPRQHRL